MAKYINPFTDFGFKLIFGTERSKPFLLSFLNAVLESEPGYETIVDIQYRDKEAQGDFIDERNVIYDIYCTTDKGHHFIVEMQNARQDSFMNRSVLYMSRAISRQAEKGSEWNFGLKPVYMISLLNFTIKDLGYAVRTDAALCNLRSKELLTNKIRFIFIQLPNFKVKVPDDCANNFERWLYTLNNMQSFDEMPFTKDDSVFADLEDVIDYANLSESDRNHYDYVQKRYLDNYHQFRTARLEAHAEGREAGLAEGRAEGAKAKAIEIAKALKKNGLSIEQIASMTGLSVEEIEG